jgi:heme-degrading monooxygenase HmoA
MNGISKYAVVFSSTRTSVEEGYSSMNDSIFEEIEKEEGYLGHEATRGADGFGINVSYWKDLDAIDSWRKNTLHRKAKAQGIDKWYESYSIKICKVEYEKDFSK